MRIYNMYILIHSATHSLQHTLYNTLSATHTLQHTLYNTHSATHTLQNTVCKTHSATHSLQHTLCNTHSATHTLQHTLYVTTLSDNFLDRCKLEKAWILLSSIRNTCLQPCFPSCFERKDHNHSILHAFSRH